jgi:hypothetical protein
MMEVYGVAYLGNKGYEIQSITSDGNFFVKEINPTSGTVRKNAKGKIIHSSKFTVYQIKANGQELGQSSYRMIDPKPTKREVADFIKNLF